jgi:YegS/Rv2252/BmrU family lipid kinase
MRVSLPEAPTLVAGDRVLVIANPATRRQIEPILATLRETAPTGVDLDIRVTTAAGEAREIARDCAGGASLVVAIGGDGTVADVAEHLDGVPLGIIAAGSTNIIGRELGIPTDFRKAVALLWGPHRLRRIDAGICNDRVFLHMTGAGFDSRFFDLTNHDLKRRVGWLAYLPAAARAMRDRPAHYHIRAGGEEFDVLSPLVLIANGASIIDPRLKLLRQIHKDDGLLDLLVVTATGPLQLARTFARIATLSFERSPFLMHIQTTEIEVSCDSPMPVQLDGDVVEHTPVRIGIRPGAVNIVCPI